MKKKADWKQDFKKFLQDNRQAIGVGLAGLGGGLIGGGILPGLIYKKPTWSSRFLLGGGTGLLTALGVLAALNKGNGSSSKGLNTVRDAVAAVKSTPDAFTGGMPTDKQFQNMGPLQRSLYGKKGEGLFSWGVRNLRRALPSGRGLRFGKLQEDQQLQKEGLSFPTSKYHVGESIGAYGGLAAGGTTWAWLHNKLHNMAYNFNRARQIGDLIGDADVTRKLDGLDDALNTELKLFRQKTGRSGFKSWLQLLKARLTLLRDSKLLPKSWRPSFAKVQDAALQKGWNPFRQKAAFGEGGKVLNQRFADWARRLQASPGSDKLGDLIAALKRNKKDYVLPAATGVKRVGRFFRRAAPVLPALLVSGLVNEAAGANDNLNNMTAQRLYEDL